MILSYARVSTIEQAADGATSLGEQARRNKAVASLRGAASFDLVEYSDRGISGSVPLAQRPAGARMLTDAKPGDVIVASKLDRLFRSAIDALQTAKDLAERKIDLILVDLGTEPVTSNGTAKMFFGMLSLVAEFERERIAERMTDAKKAKRKAGGHVGGCAPYGYRVVGVKREARLEVDPAEQEIVQTVKSLWRGTPPGVVEKKVAELGLRDRAGSPFRIVQLRRIALSRERVTA